MTASQLVPVVPGTIGNVQCLTVDGRTLHSVLGVRRVFAAWIQGRIEKYGFVQGQDFEVFSNSGKNSEGGRPSQEYTCTLDMGKELCMVENNEKGRIARRYFIECERRLLSAEPFGNPEQLTSPLSRRTDPERKQLTAIINTWVGMAPIHYAAARAQVNAHFGVASVDAMTVAQVKEAIQYVQDKIDALPVAPSMLPVDMDAGRRDALCKIRSIMDSMLAARDVVSLFCYPEPVSIDKPLAARLTYNARHDFYAAALDCLGAAYAALEAGYRLNRPHGRC